MENNYSSNDLKRAIIEGIMRGHTYGIGNISHHVQSVTESINLTRKTGTLTMGTWKPISPLTPRDQVLLTKVVGEDGKERNEQKLILSGHLWWHTDMKMYVYYRPTHWKRV